MERGIMLLSLRIIPIPLLALFIFSLIWCLDVSPSPRCTANCFWDYICWTVELLNKRGGWYTVLIFREESTSWACLDGSGLKDVFHLLAQRLTLSRSLFSIDRVTSNRKHWSIICKKLYISIKIIWWIVNIYIYIYIKTMD